MKRTNFAEWGKILSEGESVSVFMMKIYIYICRNVCPYFYHGKIENINLTMYEWILFYCNTQGVLSKYFIRLKRTLEIILLSVSLKGEPFIKKQCAAVRTINSLMIDPAQKAFHSPTLKQKEYS